MRTIKHVHEVHEEQKHANGYSSRRVQDSSLIMAQIKEDIMKLRDFTQKMSSQSPNDYNMEKKSPSSQNIGEIQDIFLQEHKLIKVLTDVRVFHQERIEIGPLAKLYSIASFGSDDKIDEIKARLSQFLAKNLDGFNKILRDGGCTNLSGQEYMIMVNSGKSDFETLMAIMSAVLDITTLIYFMGCKGGSGRHEKGKAQGMQRPLSEAASNPLWDCLEIGPRQRSQIESAKKNDFPTIRFWIYPSKFMKKYLFKLEMLCSKSQYLQYLQTQRQDSKSYEADAQDLSIRSVRQIVYRDDSRRWQLSVEERELSFGAETQHQKQLNSSQPSQHRSFTQDLSVYETQGQSRGIERYLAKKQSQQESQQADQVSKQHLQRPQKREVCYKAQGKTPQSLTEMRQSQRVIQTIPEVEEEEKIQFDNFEKIRPKRMKSVHQLNEESKQLLLTLEMDSSDNSYQRNGSLFGKSRVKPIESPPGLNLSPIEREKNILQQQEFAKHTLLRDEVQNLQCKPPQTRGFSDQVALAKLQTRGQLAKLGSEELIKSGRVQQQVKSTSLKVGQSSLQPGQLNDSAATKILRAKMHEYKSKDITSQFAADHSNEPSFQMSHQPVASFPQQQTNQYSRQQLPQKDQQSQRVQQKLAPPAKLSQKAQGQASAPHNQALSVTQQQQSREVAASQQNLDFRVTGKLKFFIEGRNYGFIVSDVDGSDIFFHYDDIEQTRLSKQFLKEAQNKYIVRLTFKLQAYYGKYNLSQKAVDIELFDIDFFGYQPDTSQATLDHIIGKFPGQRRSNLAVSQSLASNSYNAWSAANMGFNQVAVGSHQQNHRAMQTTTSRDTFQAFY